MTNFTSTTFPVPFAKLSYLLLIILVVSLVESTLIKDLPEFNDLQTYLEEFSRNGGVGKRTGDSDFGLNTLELVRKYGYPIEEHQNVQTEDDYLLDLHRIPYGKANGPSPDKPVVLLVHGIICASTDWVYMGPNKSLGYILADKGYDVWIGNNRGNTWSRKHVDLNPDDKKSGFWEFSFHEMGVYDLPTMIDYILEVTGQEKLYLVGHSQGNTDTFTLLSERPEYNEKVRLFSALAPAVSMSNPSRKGLEFGANWIPIITTIIKLLGFKEILPHTDLLPAVGSLFCSDGSPVQFLCAELLFFIVGKNPQQLNNTMIPVIASNTPAGSSFKQFEHLLQNSQSGKFRKFDYGLLGNLKEYHALVPPSYNLSKITAPVALYYGRGDNLVSPNDVTVLSTHLSSLVLLSEVVDPNWSHLDFLWGIDAPTLLYNQILSVMEEY